MIINISTGIFRVLNINTYYSIFEAQSGNFEYDLSELKDKDLITDNEINEVNNEVYMAFDSSAYMKKLGETAISFLQTNLDLSCIPFNVKIVGTGNTHSPKEYNFTGDTLEFDIEVPDNIAEILLKWVNDGNFDAEFMRKNFGSYDGFISFMPYLKSDMIEVLSEPENNDLDFAIAMIMYQIMISNGDFDKSDFERDFYEDWSVDGKNEMTNYLEGETPLYNNAMELFQEHCN